MESRPYESWAELVERNVPNAAHLARMVADIENESARKRRLASLMANGLSEYRFDQIFPLLMLTDEAVSWPTASTRLFNVLRREGDPT